MTEPQTVTFVLDNNTATDIVSLFAVLNTTQFAAIITPQTPNSNNEQPKVPGQKNMVIAVNARSKGTSSASSVNKICSYAIKKFYLYFFSKLMRRRA